MSSSETEAGRDADEAAADGDGASGGGAPGVSQRMLTLGVCTVVVAIAFESIAVATAMPVAARDLDGLALYAWAFSLFLVGMLFATVVGGRLADRIGPARPMVAGLLLFAVGLAVAGSATTMLQLVGGRLVQGLGGGVLNVSIFVCVAQTFAARDRPRVFSFISTAWVLPAFVGPPVAAWLTTRLSWHWVFFAVLPLLAFGGAMLAPTIRRLLQAGGPSAERTEGPPPAPLWAAALVAAAVAALQLAGQRLDWVSLPLLVGGLAALLIGLPRLMPEGFLRLRRGLSQVIMVRGLLPGAFFGGEAFLPLLLVEQRQVPLLLAGTTLTVGAVGWTTASWLQSRPWLPVRRDRLITAGCLAVAAGLAVVAMVALVDALPFWGAGVGWVLAGFGMGLATASTSLAVITLSDPAEQGRNGSSLNLFDAFGSSVFVALAGTLFAALRPVGEPTTAFAAVFSVMVPVALLGALCSLRIGALRHELARG